MTTTAPGMNAVFTEEYDVPIPYMQRTRDYYIALGYDNAYRWASFTEVPFTPLRTPLSRARVGTGRALQCRRQVLSGVLGDHGQRARRAHLACRL